MLANSFVFVCKLFERKFNEPSLFAKATVVICIFFVMSLIITVATLAKVCLISESGIEAIIYFFNVGLQIVNSSIKKLKLL
jgi:hypothetical protein